MPQCVALKVDKEQCSKESVGEFDRCKLHTKKLFENGPRYTERYELTIWDRKQRKEIQDQYDSDTEALLDPDLSNFERNRITLVAQLKANEAYERQMEEWNRREIAINQKWDEYTLINGVDPDAEPARLRRERERERQEMLAQVVLQRRLDRLQRLGIVPDNVQGGQGELAEFVADRQNVHTRHSVNNTTKVIETILKVPLPEEYQKDHMKTLGEIITECGLSKPTALELTGRYCSDNDIYNMGPDIYGKVLRHVWQFIKKSDDAECLKKILKTELTDNVGMCAQGNLTRICNVLSGYLEGVGDVRRSGEILQDKMLEISKLAGDDMFRIQLGVEVLKEMEVKKEEWRAWLDLLGEAPAEWYAMMGL